MKKQYRLIRILLILSGFLLITSGCATAPKLAKALYVDPAFANLDIDNIVVLPVFDARKDRSAKVNLGKILHSPIKAALNKTRKYNITFRDNYGDGLNLTEEDIAQPTKEWIQSLGKNGDRWIMLIVVEDLQSRMTFGSVASAEVSGVLYDRVNGTVIWQHKGTAKTGQGGLIGMMMKGSLTKGALRSCLHRVFSSFPKKREKPATSHNQSSSTEKAIT